MIAGHNVRPHAGNNHFAYRDLVTAFPSSLRRLEIINAREPEIKVTAIAKSIAHA